MEVSRLKRPRPAEGPSLRMIDGDVVSTRWPTVVEFLCRTQWEDGTARAPGSVTLFLEAGGAKVCVSDKDADRIAFVTGRTWGEALDAAEAGLEADSLDWRASRARRK